MNDKYPNKPNWAYWSSDYTSKTGDVKYKKYATESVPKKTVLDEAKFLVYGPRADQYGSALKQYEKLAAVWSQLVGKNITAEQAVLMMIGLKLVRAFDQVPNPDKETLTDEEKNKHWDSIVDLAGYCRVIGKIEEERNWW